MKKSGKKWDRATIMYHLFIVSMLTIALITASLGKVVYSFN